MKTDAELNRLIAERVMGWREMPDGDFGGLYQTPDLRLRGLPAYCTDPAAWGALFVWLAERSDNHDLRLAFHQKWYAANVMGLVKSDPLPGRALVLATLAAYGVTEVEE